MIFSYIKFFQLPSWEFLPNHIPNLSVFLRLAKRINLKWHLIVLICISGVIVEVHKFESHFYFNLSSLKFFAQLAFEWCVFYYSVYPRAPPPPALFFREIIPNTFLTCKYFSQLVFSLYFWCFLIYGNFSFVCNHICWFSFLAYNL